LTAEAVRINKCARLTKKAGINIIEIIAFVTHNSRTNCLTINAVLWTPLAN